MSRKRTLILLTILPIVVQLIALCFLPAQIAIHYDMHMQVTGYTSKYVLLILGVIILGFGGFMLSIYKSQEGSKYEKLVYRLAMAGLLIFQVINIGGLLGAFIN